MFNGKISVREASEMLDLTPKYLRTLAQEGKIPFYKPFNGKIYFSIKDLEKMFEENRYKSVSEIIAESQ